MAAILERSIAWLLKSRRGHDSGLFHKSAPFIALPEPTISVECNIGPSGSEIPAEYGFFKGGLFPTLKWPTQDSAVEYLLVVEDPDAPLAEPVVHGLYYGIPATKTSLANEDFEKTGGEAGFKLAGGFQYGLNRRKNVYIPPRGLLGHGPHRYFYQIVALKEPVDATKLSVLATKEEVIREIGEKIISWGSWEGVWERKE